MNTPTKITMVRIMLTPLMLFFYLADFIPYNLGKLFAFICFFGGVMTDFLDGYLARKNNQVTNLGKFLDPIADKLLVTTCMVLLITGANPVIPTITGIIFMFFNLQRDYMITGFRQIGQLKGIIVASDIPGKLKAILQYITLNICMFYAYIRELSWGADHTLHIVYLIVMYSFIVLTCLFMIISEVNYVIKNPNVLKDEPKETTPKTEEEKSEATTTQS